MNIYDKKPREAIDLADADLYPTNSSNQTEPSIIYSNLQKKKFDFTKQIKITF